MEIEGYYEALIAVIVLIIVITALGALYNQEFQDKQKAEVVALVNGAAQLISEKGDQAFSELRKEPWVKGDLYVFVWRMDGI